MNFFPASVIARVLKHDKKTVVSLAARAAWPRRKRGNCFEYRVPRGLLAKCLAASPRHDLASLRGLSISPARRAENRFAAIWELQNALQAGESVERTLVRVSRDFEFHCSPNSLRRWQRQFADKGFGELLESKRGHSGRKRRKR